MPFKGLGPRSLRNSKTEVNLKQLHNLFISQELIVYFLFKTFEAVYNLFNMLK